MGKLFTFCIMMIAVSVPAFAQDMFPLQPHPQDVAWPTEAWEVGEMPAETTALVAPLMDKAIAGDKSELMGETRAVVIIHGGKLVAEAYRDGFGPTTKQVSFSVAKSVTQALVGRAVQIGLIEDIDAPMPTPFATDDPRNAITWRQWLNMTDGLDYKDFASTPFIETDTVQMMFGSGKYDVVGYVRDELPPKYEPGTHWNYSTEGYHLLGWAFQNSLSKLGTDLPIDDRTAEEELAKIEEIARELQADPDASDEVRDFDIDAYAHEARENFAAYRALPRPQRTNVNERVFASAFLFGLIGMDAQPEFDSSGTYLGGSFVWASAHDFAKFGYLYLRDGVWDGQRLLPEGWVDFARTETPAENSNVYGAGWWVTVNGDRDTPTTFQSAATPPWDAFNANGSEGQTIWVVPSRDLVIVRLGLMNNTPEDWSALFEWNQEIARAFPAVMTH